MAGVTMASTAMSVAASYQQAQAESQYQDSLANASAQQQALNRKLAIDSMVRQSEAENLRLQQEDATASEQIIQSNVRAAKAAAAARVAGASAGVTGVSLENLYGDYARENSRYTDAIRVSRENDVAATALRKEGFRAEAENRILSLAPYIPRPIAQPSAFASALRIGAAGFEGYSRYSINNPRQSLGGATSRG
jgi:hypothetical protein